MTPAFAGEPTAGWLPAVVPADAQSVRCQDPAIAEALADAGASQVDEEPVVEIVGSAGALRGDAQIGVVIIDSPRRTSGSRATRAARRLVATTGARSRARLAQRALRRHGYETTSVLLWDLRQHVRTEGIPARRLQLVDRLPGRALAIGRRPAAEASALHSVVAEASRQIGGPLDVRWASIRSGVLLAEVDGGILRVAIGPGRIQIDSQAAALEHLGSAQLPALVADRVPWLRARGRTGLADWSLERLLPGTRPARALGASLVDECREFLVALHSAAGGQAPGPSHADLAETAASVCEPEGARRARSLAERLDGELAGIRRGFGHGDFFAGNLLVADERVTAVLDWDAAGPGRLPLVDLLHLELTQGGYRTDDDWGDVLLERLLPAARAGGSEQIRRYCEDLGLRTDPHLLESLVLSYWLGYVDFQLRTHPARRSEPVWIERNVQHVLREVEALAGTK